MFGRFARGEELTEDEVVAARTFLHILGDSESAHGAKQLLTDRYGPREDARPPQPPAPGSSRFVASISEIPRSQADAPDAIDDDDDDEVGGYMTQWRGGSLPIGTETEAGVSTSTNETMR